MNMEELHQELEGVARRCVEQHGQMIPSLFLVTPAGILPVDLREAFECVPKSAIGHICAEIVKSTGSQLAATAMGANIYLLPTKLEIGWCDPSAIPKDAVPRNVVIITIQTPDDARTWIYDVEVLEGGSHRIAPSAIKPEGQPEQNAFDLFPADGVLS